MPTIQDTLAQFSIPFRQAGEHQHARSGWVQIDCPYCSPRSNHFRMGISLQGGYCNCWACGHKRLLDVLVTFAGISYSRAYEIVEGLGWSAPVKKTEGHHGQFEIPKDAGPLWGVHREWLRGRGMDPEEITRLWGVRGIGLSSSLAWRIWIPVCDQFGEPASWTTRAVGDVDLRYINAKPEQERISLKHLLYGLHYVRHAAIVVEGPTDVWAIGPGAIAVMGLSYTQEQMLMLSSIPLRAICFDAERAAQKRAQHLCEQLQLFPGKTVMVELQTGKDPAEASRQEVQELRREILEK